MSQSDGQQQGFLARWIRGNPPAVQPADQFARYGWFVAWVLTMVGILSGTLSLLAPAGFVVMVIGLMVLTNYQGVRDSMRLREEQGLNYRLTESRSATKFGGAVMVVIGVGFLAGALVATMGAQ